MVHQIIKNAEFKIECHSSTPKQDLIDFVNIHRGKIIILHWESNMYDTWGDDDFTEYDTSNDEKFNSIVETIKTHFIHNIWVK